MTEEAEENHFQRPAVTLRLQQILDVLKIRERTTPKQRARLLGTQPNTPYEHPRLVEKLGYLRHSGEECIELRS